MAERLPVVGTDTGAWGAILDGFLGVGHNTDGSHRPVVNAKEYGCYCDKTHDDSAALMTILENAAWKYAVEIPYPGCKAKLGYDPSHPFPYGTHLRGAARSPYSIEDGVHTRGFVWLESPDSDPVIEFNVPSQGDYDAGVVCSQRSIIENLGMAGSGECIRGDAGCTDTRFLGLELWPGTGSGFHFKEFFQDNIVADCQVNGGTGDGFKLEFGRKSAGTWGLNSCDKNKFLFNRFQGMSGSGSDCQSNTAYDNLWLGNAFTHIKKHGQRFGGGWHSLNLIDESIEDAGSTSPTVSVFVPQAASISAGSKVLTVTNTALFSGADTLTIKGVGTGGQHLITTIDSIDNGTTMHIHDAAVVSSVAGCEVTNAIYSSLVTDLAVDPLGGTHGGAYEINVIGGQYGYEESAALRYAWDAEFLGAPWSRFMADCGARPIYDPNGFVLGLGVGQEPYAPGPERFERAVSAWGAITGTRTGNLAQLQDVVQKMLLHGMRIGLWSDQTS